MFNGMIIFKKLNNQMAVQPFDGCGPWQGRPLVFIMKFGSVFELWGTQTHKHINHIFDMIPLGTQMQTK